MADTKIGDLTELAVTPATGDQFFVSDISEADDDDKGKYITWGTIDAAIDTIITANADGYLVAANDLSDVASASTARTNLGLAIGTDVQAYDAGLADIAGLAVTDGNIIVGDGVNWVAESGATARTSLGLAIGTNVQAWDDDLDDIAALTPTKGNLLVGNGTDWIALGVGTDTHVVTADSAEASGIKWAASAGGGASLTVDTRANILATASPSSGDMYYATDTEEFFVHDGTDFQVAPLEHQATSTTPDMGLQPPTVVNDLAGYSDEYITDKLIANSRIGSNANTNTGGLRTSSGTLQFYANAAWNDVVTGFRFREDSGDGEAGNIYELEHKPIGLTRWYEVMSGNSDILGANGLPVTQQYATDMGSNPTELQIVGRSFS